MADLPFLDKPWDLGKIRRLVLGHVVEDATSRDGYRDVPGSSAYMQRMQALDKGDPLAMLDAIQLEQRIDQIADVQARAAVTLAVAGWHEWEIGAALRSNRTGGQLVRAGVKAIARQGRTLK